MASLDRAENDDEHEHKIHSGDSVAEKHPLPLTPTRPVSRISQSDSGICLTPISQSGVLSPQQTNTIAEVSEECAEGADKELLLSGGSSRSAELARENCPPCVNQDSSSQPKEEISSTASLFPGYTKGSDGAVPKSDHNRKTSPRHGKCSSSPTHDDFTYQTKYLVLQFLHQSTTEEHLLPLSQNSMSTTSESEPRVRSYAERLRRRWQQSGSQSSPTSPQPRTRSRHAKLKGSKSSPNLTKDAAHFSTDGRPERKPRTRRAQPSKAARGSRKSTVPSKHSPVQTVVATSLIRSVSENTDNSETGTYMSDADDELDTSFDSSHQGSATSLSLRNKLAHYHHQTFRTSLPTVQSETESVCEVPLDAAEQSIVDDGSPLPIMDMGSGSVNHYPVLTAERYFRVTDYLGQMRETQADAVPEPATVSFAGETDQGNGEGEGVETDLPQPFTSRPDEPVTGQLFPSDQAEDGAVSGGFEPSFTNAYFPDEMEGACGGVDVNDVGDAGDDVRHGQRADRSKLRLDIHDQDAVVLIEAVHSLRQEIEEEISSFESELEEAMQSHQSDHSLFGLSHSHSVSPETAEIARRLARIGDEVQQKYFDHLDRAVGRLFLDNCAGLFTYENFREAAMTALDADLHGWRQVATVLLYSQHVALHLARGGRQILHRIIDYTVRLLADTAADFIIDQGGWAGVSSMDPSSVSSSPELAGTGPPAFRGQSITDPPAQDGSRSRRSLFGPDLRSGSPGEPHLSLDRLTPVRLSPEAQATASSSASSSWPSSSAQQGGEGQGTAVQQSEEESAEKTEGEASGGDGAASVEGQSGVSSGVLTGCAVSAVLIGVGVVAALSIIRR